MPVTHSQSPGRIKDDIPHLLNIYMVWSLKQILCWAWFSNAHLGFLTMACRGTHAVGKQYNTIQLLCPKPRHQLLTNLDDHGWLRNSNGWYSCYCQFQNFVQHLVEKTKTWVVQILKAWSRNSKHTHLTESSGIVSKTKWSWWFFQDNVIKDRCSSKTIKAISAEWASRRLSPICWGAKSTRSKTNERIWLLIEMFIHGLHFTWQGRMQQKVLPKDRCWN